MKSEEAHRQKEEAKKAKQAAEKMDLHLTAAAQIKCLIHQQAALALLNQLQDVSHLALADVLAETTSD